MAVIFFTEGSCGPHESGSPIGVIYVAPRLVSPKMT